MKIDFALSYPWAKVQSLSVVEQKYERTRYFDMVYKIEFYYGYYWTTHMLISEKRLFFYIGPNFAIEQQKFEVKGPVLVNYMHFYYKADKYSNVFEK